MDRLPARLKPRGGGDLVGGQAASENRQQVRGYEVAEVVLPGAAVGGLPQRRPRLLEGRWAVVGGQGQSEDGGGAFGAPAPEPNSPNDCAPSPPQSTTTDTHFETKCPAARHVGLVREPTPHLQDARLVGPEVAGAAVHRPVAAVDVHRRPAPLVVRGG